ncbi:SGNH/GDSL hydrolase family protein [Streptomyces sp. NPDC056188]|uniref:SGNH/GDSL hydrolase family protein n=1 Tax=Streptomyces sp. NPDC056188 TaxID=3345740 RepID=UPI0035E2BE5D
MASTTRPKYVAIGDSFTAGAGIKPEVEGGRCGGQSERNYPHQLANAMNWDLTDLSCNGASLTKRQGGAGGFWDKAYGVEDPMIDSVTSDTDYVTFQLGGNDSGVSTEFLKCVTDGLPTGEPYNGRGLSNRLPGACQERNEANFTIHEAAAEIEKALREIHKRAPHAQVAVVGYPAVIPQDETKCQYDGSPIPLLSNQLGPMNHADLAWLRGKFEEFNVAIEGAVADVAEDPEFKVAYVDTYDAFKGHEPCQLPTPNRWIWPIPAPLLSEHAMWGAAHPNGYGHDELTKLVAAALPITGQ